VADKLAKIGRSPSRLSWVIIAPTRWFLLLLRNLGRLPKSSLRSARPRGHLLRILGVGFGIAVIIGNTVGVGILRTPGEIAARLQNSGLMIAVWLVGGLYAFFCTLSVIELGTTLPREGGWYVYSCRAFGDFGGFLVGCSDWIMQSTAVAYLAIALGEFVAELQPALRGDIKLMAVASLSLLTLLNWIGLRAGSRAQQLTSLAKVLALVGLVIACFAISPSVAPATASGPAGFLVPRGGILLAIVLALQPIIITYDGWYGAIYFMEEDEDPVRNLPRSSIGGVLACIAIYLLVNAALLHVLPIARLAASQMPAADAAMAVFGGRGKQIILIMSLVCAISTINALLLVMPRILFGMSRDGLLPRGVSSVNAGGTPTTALLLGTLVAVALVLSGSFEKLIAIASFLFVSVYLSGFCALFVLRVREPNLSRPFKAWGYPWTTLGVLLVSASFLAASVVGDLKDALFTLILIALSYPIYLALTMRKRLRAAAADAVTTPSE
jgi:basic amino acid/polyamine antiporter, APA family